VISPDTLKYVATRAAATIVADRRYAEFMDLDDMTQEALVWLVEHPTRVERATDERGQLYLGQILAEVGRHLSGIARQEYTRATGRDPLEGARYTPAKVRSLLPATWTGEGPEKPADGQPRGKASPARGGDHITGVWDVREALDKTVSRQDQGILFRLYVLGATSEEVAEKVDLTATAVRARAHRAVKAVCTWLNGEWRQEKLRPGRTLSDGPGTRRAIPNETAQVVTGQSYYGG